MEDVLHLYNLPLDEKRPLVCFDELPMQLLGEVVAPLPIKEGVSKHFDYEYQREGTAVLLVAFEQAHHRNEPAADESRLLPVYPSPPS